jgi:hypothetical protein
MSSKQRKPKTRFFISALEDAQSARLLVDSPQCRSSSYRLAYQDEEFLLRDELRPVRLQLELLKPELILQENHIESTVVIFGSARIAEPETAEAQLVSAEAEHRKNKNDAALKQKVYIARRALANSKYYEEARKLGSLISSSFPAIPAKICWSWLPAVVPALWKLPTGVPMKPEFRVSA